MDSYNQPWTVINKYEQYQSEQPKSYEYCPTGGFEGVQCHKKPQYEGAYKTYSNKWEKPEGISTRWENKIEGAARWEKPEGLSRWEKPEGVSRWEKPEGVSRWEKPEGVSRWEKPEGLSRWEKPEGLSRWEKPQGGLSRWEQPEILSRCEKPEYCGGKWEKPEYCGGKWEKLEKPEWKNIEKICGEWEKVCDSFERLGQQEGRWEGETTMKPRWRCQGNKCCDVEMINLVKDMINILIGAEQSYIQLGFLCMDEKFTLVNTSEYFRLCGLRMHWLANGLINKSVRLFNVNEWINTTTFENFFKVPTKEELATNDYTNIIKTFFKIAMEAETRLVERMTVLGEKMIKADWVNSECRFDGFKWFVNFVLPYQTHFVREMTGHYRNIEMCNNGFVFDKCEMYPLVQKIEEFIHQITKINGTPVWEKNGIVPTKRW